MTWRVLEGDVAEVLRTLPDESVHCVVTSPPYWGLRDYGTGEWEGGDAECDHASPRGGRREGLLNGRGQPGQSCTSWGGEDLRRHRGTCANCGATRVDRQIGLEDSPDAWVANLVKVFREVRRVLRADGTCWANLGDSYAGNPPGNDDSNGSLNRKPRSQPVAPPRSSLAAKQLIGQPWRLAFALQADGWWLRSEIIWSKPNPMPESCTDRPTKAHETVFLLAKSARYFYDADAVREPGTGLAPGNVKPDAGFAADPVRFRTRSVIARIAGTTARNARTVWTIATQPYPEAHFATFPEELPRRCILAGTSAKGCCPKCGAPWVRVTRDKFQPQGDVSAENGVRGHDAQKPNTSSSWQGTPRGTTERETTGWRPSCSCDHEDEGGHQRYVPEPIPCTVLDPFSGAGTTGLLAHRLGRDYIGIELNPEYAEMSRERIRSSDPLEPQPVGGGLTQRSLFNGGAR